MRLATIKLEDGATTAAVHDGSAWRTMASADLSQWFASTERDAEAQAALESGEVVDGGFSNPVPNPRKVICCGLNYANHIEEMGRETPTYPTLFTKFADSLIGDGDHIVIHGSDNVDWEAELTVVVGKRLTQATEDEAIEAIAGYTVANDISMRDWQRRTLQWFQGKAWDASTPVGPFVVTPDELDLEKGLGIRCLVNDEAVQDDNTNQLVFTPARLLAYISEFTTLYPGDLVLTGTPGGVGMGMEPPRSLNSGDIVVTEVDGIGRLTNPITIINNIR